MQVENSNEYYFTINIMHSIIKKKTLPSSIITHLKFTPLISILAIVYFCVESVLFKKRFMCANFHYRAIVYH